MWMEGVHFQISRRKGTRCADSVSVFPLATPPFKNVFRFVFYYFVTLADKERSNTVSTLSYCLEFSGMS